MGDSYFIASCVFTSKYPQVSAAVRDYAQQHYGLKCLRCCVPNYKVEEFNERIADNYRNDWKKIPHCADFQAGDTVYSICHNCSAILKETKPNVKVKSIWELILSDNTFQYPNYDGTKITLQDCWRANDNYEEQDAVRAILVKMNFEIIELENNRNKTEFCGLSLYRPQPKRNPELAPRRYKEMATGKFIPKSRDEQEKIMREYCRQFKTDKVIAYCHYCLEGLDVAGMDSMHLASLLFNIGAWQQQGTRK